MIPRTWHLARAYWAAECGSERACNLHSAKINVDGKILIINIEFRFCMWHQICWCRSTQWQYRYLLARLRACSIRMSMSAENGKAGKSEAKKGVWLVPYRCSDMDLMQLYHFRRQYVGFYLGSLSSSEGNNGTTFSSSISRWSRHLGQHYHNVKTGKELMNFASNHLSWMRATTNHSYWSHQMYSTCCLTAHAWVYCW